MVVVFFNILGLGMLAVSCLTGVVVIYLLNASGNAPFMLVAGPIALACDAIYRWQHPAGHWLHPNGGGNFCFVPVWVIGLLWLILGTVYKITGQDEPGVLGAVIVGLVALVIVAVAIFRAMPADSPSSSLPEPSDWECSRCGHRNAARARVCQDCHLQI